MQGSNLLFKVLGIDNNTDVRKFSRSVEISVSKLKFYNKTNILPSGSDLDKICAVVNLTPAQLMLKMGIIDRRIKSAIHKHADEIFNLLAKDIESDITDIPKPKIMHKTKLGRLYRGDCINLMRTLENDSIDLIFADPPFNLKKIYPSEIDDNLKEYQYLNWCENWASECVRLLKPGGSLFIWNIPRWNTFLSEYLNCHLTFRHWISVDIKYSLPIQGRLYPSHYSLLYYCKGEKPNVFKPDRLPMPVCPHCTGDLKD